MVYKECLDLPVCQGCLDHLDRRAIEVRLVEKVQKDPRVRLGGQESRVNQVILDHRGTPVMTGDLVLEVNQESEGRPVPLV